MTFLQPIEGGNVAGLALANSLGVAFEVITLLWILRRRWQGVNEDTLARTTLKTLAASTVMALFIVIVDAIWRATGLVEQGLMFTVIHIGIAVGGGALVFIGTATLLKMDELHTLIRLVLRRQPAAEAAV
ncbi:MAG: hypothetical protein K8I82_02285, partial [Anaerolineae bacterium]|nr:hypothetical protein [Anaerolineae bacterium]